MKDVYQITKTRCNNIERKSSRDKMKEMKPPSSLCYIKTEWAEICIETDVVWNWDSTILIGNLGTKRYKRRCRKRKMPPVEGRRECDSYTTII